MAAHCFSPLTGSISTFFIGLGLRIAGVIGYLRIEVEKKNGLASVVTIFSTSPKLKAPLDDNNDR